MSSTRSYIKRIDAKIDSLVESGIWPTSNPGKINHGQWFNNFDDSEKDLAAALVDIFVYFPDVHILQILSKAMRILFQKMCEDSISVKDRKNEINSTLENTLFVPIEGETPNPTDSGNYICRLLRQSLGIDESKIQTVAVALDSYISGEKLIVFVDDFVGSGNQVLDTWNRKYTTNSPNCFREAYINMKRESYLICLASTHEGRQRITSECTGLNLICTHSLTQRDNFSNSLLRISDHPSGDQILDRALNLLNKYSSFMSLPDYMLLDRHAQFGFNELSLTHGFQHSIPDSTLPIYWGNETSNWTPLVKRS